MPTYSSAANATTVGSVAFTRLSRRLWGIRVGAGGGGGDGGDEFPPAPRHFRLPRSPRRGQ